MNNYKIQITVPAETPTDAQHLAELLQTVAAKVAYPDMVKLLSAAAKKPSMVKTALKFM
jgi:capsular polysaccharide biosynthesis protein